MTLLFLCGSIEPGRDGVGDYSRRLAEELIRQGYNVAVVALFDKGVDVISEQLQKSEVTRIPVLRIPINTSSKIRYTKAKQYITNYNPEWLSLQYVPFSFQGRGLPFALGSELAQLGKGRKWHIMFHELWVGMDREAPLKHFIWGKVQQQIIRKMINKLCPQVIHTQSLLYQAQLNKLGFQVLHLPLFGNIPVIGAKTAQLNKNKKTMTFVVFGSIHPGAPIQQFATELLHYRQKHQLNVQFIFIGRCGPELNNWVSVCAQTGIEVKVLGEQKSEKISAILQYADWAISSTPFLLCEKSGTVAAMLEHQLPVLCVARSWQVKRMKKINMLDSIQLYKEDSLENIFTNINTVNPSNTVSQISLELIEVLKIN